MTEVTPGGAPRTSLYQSFKASSFADVIRKERTFLIFIGLSFFIAGVVFQRPDIAMWIGFMFAGYSAIANDSIQTVGTFIASNSKRPWWVLWLFIGGIFLVTVYSSWVMYDGDVSWRRLTSKGFDVAPSSFTFLQVAAPIFLLIITRLRMPVSTTFLILSCFSTDLDGITGMLTKSLSGYFVAFFSAIIVWVVLSRLMRKWFTGEAAWYWTPIQWVTSGTLWAVWLMQDAANIAVYLPRSLSIVEFGAFAGFIFFGLGILFYLKGDRIQQVVTEKSFVTDMRPASIIDFVYAFILYYFKVVSVVPMSTTWVFIGLLAGRELGMSLMDRDGHGKPYKKTFQLILKDISYAGIGLLVSIILAVSINPLIRAELFSYFQ
jgi:hypothetical protein